MIKIIIPGMPPSANKYLGNSHNYNIYRFDKKKWQRIILEASTQVIPKEPIKKAIVEIKYYFPDGRKRDYDNYIKFILDGLIRARILEDDNFRVITKLILTADVDRNNPRIEVKIFGLEEYVNDRSFTGKY